jgi:uncharacterized protein
LLLRFKVANHRSLRDLVELSLASPRLRGNVPSDGDWVGATTRVAGIYGANASGKSTVLHALDFMTKAIELSATTWAGRDSFPFHPYRLDAKYNDMPSMYEVDVVIDEVRYTYGFESNYSGIISEWLYSYHSPWKRTLLERSPAGFHFGRGMPGENMTISKLVSPVSLFLSVAANNNHPLLRPLHHHITEQIRYAKFADNDKNSRLRWIRTLIEDNTLRKQTEELINLADLGITGVKIKKKRLTEDALAVTRKVYDAFLKDSAEEGDAISLDDFIEDMQRQIHFEHYSDSSDTPITFGIDDESSGTIAWLTLGVPALYALKYGETYLVDEVDSSLHPRLTAVLIQMFKDPALNPKGAQLVFTSHDASLLGKLLGDVLKPEEVWFIEKKGGASELYSLDEFPVRSSDNFEKRYLEGRYGAVPIIQPSEIREALLEIARR